MGSEGSVWDGVTLMWWARPAGLVLIVVGVLLGSLGAVPVTGAVGLWTADGSPSASHEVQGAELTYSLTEIGPPLMIETQLFMNDAGLVAGIENDEDMPFRWNPHTGETKLAPRQPDAAFWEVMDVNERGQVVGAVESSEGVGHGFLWDPDSVPVGFTTFGPNGSRARAMNDRGQVLGYTGTDTTFVWDSQTGLRELPDGFVGMDINDAGQVVGRLEGSSTAGLWNPDTGISDLGGIERGRDSWGSAVNEKGQVAGWSHTPDGGTHPFLWDPVTGMTDLGTLPGFSTSRGEDINDQGQVIGSSRCDPSCADYEAELAFLWDPESGMNDLGLLPGQRFSTPTDLNEAGQVVGSCGTSEDDYFYELHLNAVLWDPGVGMIDLGTADGDEDSRALSINEFGEVVGWSGTIEGGNEGFDEGRVAFWTPLMGELPRTGQGAALWLLAASVLLMCSGSWLIHLAVRHR